MNMTSHWTDGLVRSAGVAASAVLRVAFALAALLVMLAVMGFGLLLGTGLVAWALIRGRRPVMVKAFGPAHTRWSEMRAAASRRQGAAQGEVVDVEVRELAPQRTE